jgi:hypothetical protein
MKMRCAMTAAVLALLAMPFAAQAQGVGEGAKGRTKGPVLAIVHPDRSAGSWGVLSAG